MKMFRKLVSIVAAATVLTSSLAFSISAQAAQIDDAAAVASEPNIQENAGDGVILHAFNWSYNSIKQNLPQLLFRLHLLPSRRTSVRGQMLPVSGQSSISLSACLFQTTHGSATRLS